MVVKKVNSILNKVAKWFFQYYVIFVVFSEIYSCNRLCYNMEFCFHTVLYLIEIYYINSVFVFTASIEEEASEQKSRSGTIGRKKGTAEKNCQSSVRKTTKKFRHWYVLLKFQLFRSKFNLF